MPNFLFSPGPTHLPDEVRQKLSLEPPHHRSQAFKSFFLPALENLKRLFQTQGEVAVLACSGSGAMEAAALNFNAPRDHVLILEGGKFGRRWVDICQRIGCYVEVVSLPMGEDAEPDILLSPLSAGKRFKTVFLTQVESSSGSLFNIPALAEVIKNHSDAAIIVDVVASLAADAFHQDLWQIDAAVGCSQKGLMCPPGLGFVAVSTAGKNKLRQPDSLYWNLPLYFDYHRKGQTPFTPAISLIWAMSTTLEMITKQGLTSIWQEKSRLAYAFRSAIIAAGLTVFPRNPASALTVFRLPPGVMDKDVILDLEQSTGFRISGGQGEAAGIILRIAHMGAVAFEDLYRLLPPLFLAIDKSLAAEKTGKALTVFADSYKNYSS